MEPHVSRFDPRNGHEIGEEARPGCTQLRHLRVDVEWEDGEGWSRRSHRGDETQRRQQVDRTNVSRAGCEMFHCSAFIKETTKAEWFAWGQVHILLPPLQKLRTIVERLRPLSDVIAVRCNNNGKLQISVQTESASVDTQWSGCTNPKMGASSPLLQLHDPYDSS